MKINRNRVLVTGASGYIGYNFSKFLLEKGFSVHLLVRKTSVFKDSENTILSQIHYYDGNSNSVDKILSEFQIDVVFHLATYYNKSDDPITLAKLNNVCIKLTSQLLEAIRKQEHSILFINIGTIWQTHDNYSDAYTIFKAFQEEIVKFFSNKYGIKSISLLLNDVYGPCDTRPKLLNQIKSSVRENNEINITNPNALINLVYIDDVCDALFHSISLLETQEMYFYSYKLQVNRTIKIRDLITSIETILGYPLRVNYGTNSHSSNLVIKDVDTIPKWEPKVDINDGLVRFFDDKEKI